MAQAQAFDLIAFKQKMREEWSNAADGWRRWCHVVEGKESERPAESFDAVVSRALLMFLPDVPRTLRRLRSFLKPGGRFAASVWGEKGKVQFATSGDQFRRSQSAIARPMAAGWSS